LTAFCIGPYRGNKAMLHGYDMVMSGYNVGLLIVIHTVIHRGFGVTEQSMEAVACRQVSFVVWQNRKDANQNTNSRVDEVQVNKLTRVSKL